MYCANEFVVCCSFQEITAEIQLGLSTLGFLLELSLHVDGQSTWYWGRGYPLAILIQDLESWRWSYLPD